MNRLTSLRLTERRADFLISVHKEVVDAGHAIVEGPHTCSEAAYICFLNNFCSRSGVRLILLL